MAPESHVYSPPGERESAGRSRSSHVYSESCARLQRCVPCEPRAYGTHTHSNRLWRQCGLSTRGYMCSEHNLCCTKPRAAIRTRAERARTLFQFVCVTYTKHLRHRYTGWPNRLSERRAVCYSTAKNPNNQRAQHNNKRASSGVCAAAPGYNIQLYLHSLYLPPPSVGRIRLGRLISRRRICRNNCAQLIRSNERVAAFVRYIGSGH